MKHLATVLAPLVLGTTVARAEAPPFLELYEPGLLTYGYDYTPSLEGVVSNFHVDQQSGGSAYVTGASATSNFWARATMGQGLNLPELKLYAEARGNPDRTYTEAFALAVQHYTYTGTTETSYTLRLTLDGIYQGTNGGVEAGLGAALYYLDDNGELVVDYDAVAPVNLSVGADSISGPHYTLTGDMTFTLTPGGGIDLFSRLEASAIPGRNGWSIQDVSHTYSMALVSGDATLLVAAISAVPDVPSGALLAAGLLLISAHARRRRRAPAATLACAAMAAMLAGPLQAAPAAPSSRPSDDQVRKDIWRDGSGMLDFRTTSGRSGEFEWEERTQSWFFQRGFIVTREARLPEFPQARLEVGGLAVYRLAGGSWQFQKQLTTFNRYTGIPAPGNDELIAIAQQNKEAIFRRDIRYMPAGIASMALAEQQPPNWHNLNTLSYWVDARYDYRVPSNGSVVPCLARYEVRLFRPNAQAAWGQAAGLNRRVLEGCGAPGR